jgi:hypothetical protein
VTLFLLLIILPLVCSQSLAFWFYRTGSKSLACWALGVCLPIIILAVMLQVPEQFTPATNGRLRIRQSAFLAHVILAGVELVVFIVACLSPWRSEPVTFWIAWGLSLNVIAAFVSAFLFSLSGPAT